jgi:hypothetical protein
MDELKLSTPLVNAILSYLSKRPWEESNVLIAEIQKQATTQGAVPVEQPKAED